MPHREVKDRIGELKQELEKAPQETGQLEELLEHAREEIERYTPEAVQDFLLALKREASEFEREHPRVTALVNQITTLLSDIGI